MLIIENATEIYSTDSCTTMLVEMLNSPRTKKHTVITRQPNFKELEIMYNLNWNYIRGAV